VLVLVVAVLTVSYASSLKAYFQQRAHIDDLKSQIAQSQADIDRMQKEKQRWGDPAYIKEQARARLGYLMPGQTSYVVLGQDGKPLETKSTLSDPSKVIVTQPTPWWTSEWKSVQLAGNPPPPASKQPPPATRIDAPTP
jgi:cell division protein FtsL